MNPDNFIVRPHRRHLEKYAVREQWSKLSAEDALEVTLHLAGLPAELPQEDETAKRFDLLLLNLQLACWRKPAPLPATGTRSWRSPHGWKERGPSRWWRSRWS